MEESKMPPIEELKRIETVFKSRCITQQVKFKSRAYYKMQLEFFSGAMAALNICPPHWIICITSNREIIENYG
jgi:hypothetical protein